MQKEVRQYAVWLNAIRGLAALVVFLGHARVVLIGSIVGAMGTAGADIAAKAVEFGKLPEQTSFGHMAVIVFFVLSGYLVGGGAIRALRGNRWSASGYAIQRLSRLWTVLIPVLLLGYLIDHVGVSMAQPGSIYTAPPGQNMVFVDLPEKMTFSNMLLNMVFLQKIIGKPFGTNSPLWTLSYEFWFYVAFPFLMFLLARTSSASKRVVCALALAVIAALVGPIICTYFCFWLMGVAIEIVRKPLPTKIALRGSVIGSVLFIALLAVILKAKPPIVLADAVEACAFAGLCYLIVHLQDARRYGVVGMLASGLSAMSYTLYLIHAPVIAFISNLLMPVWRPWPVNAIGLAKFGAVSVTVFLSAILFYWLFERNTPQVRRFMTRLLDRSGQPLGGRRNTAAG